MNGPHEKGGATPPMLAGPKASEQFCRYHGPAHPYKVRHFTSDGVPIKAKGKVAAFLQALMTAGDMGVAHVDCLPWQFNPSDAVKRLENRGVKIEPRPGKPHRWIFRSSVQEVQP